MRKHHKHIILIAVFIAGLIVLWWANVTEQPTTEEELRRSRFVLPALASVPETRIKRIEIESPKETLVFERRGRERWQMTKPVDASADAALVGTLVRNLKELRKSLDAGEVEGAPRQYGLEPPAATIRVFGNEPETLLATLTVGTEIAGLDDRRYVRPVDQGGNPRDIEVVDGRRLGAVGKPIAEWRDKTLFNTPTFYVSELGVSGPGRDLKAKREEGHWQLLAPVTAPADDEKMEGVLAELTSLRVAEKGKGYVADNVKDLAPYGLDKPELTIDLKTAWGGGETQTVQIGKPVPGKDDLYYAKQKDQDDVVLVNGKELRDLGKGRNTFRSKRVAFFEAPRVEFIEIHAFGRDFRLSRSADGWFLLGPSSREKADTASVQNLLLRLGEAQTSDFFEPSAIREPGLDPPFMTVRIWQSEKKEKPPAEPPSAPQGEPAVHLLIGRHDAIKRALYARVAGDPTILALTTTVFDVLPKNRFAFKDLTIQTLSPAKVSKLTVVRDGETYVLEAPAGASKSLHWRMTAPVAAPADDEQVTKMVLILSNLHADSFVSDKLGDGNGKAFGLDKPTLTASWELQSDSESSASDASKSEPTSGTLRVGARLPNSENSYAHVTGNPMVFTLGPDALQPFREEFRDHVVLSFPPEKAQRLVLRWPDRALAFVPKIGPGGITSGWTADLGLDASGFDLSRLDSLVRSLAHLTTPKYVQYLGIFPASAGLNPPHLTIEVQVAGEKTPRVLRIGNKSDEGPLLATTEAGSAGPLFLLPGPAWPELLRSPKKPSELPDNPFARPKDQSR